MQRVMTGSVTMNGGSASTQLMTGSLMVQSALSLPGDAHSSIGSSCSDVGLLNPDMPPVERLYRLLERFETSASTSKLSVRRSS